MPHLPTQAPPGYWQLTEGYQMHEIVMLSNAVKQLGPVEHIVVDGEDGYQIWRKGGQPIENNE